ncbi:MAG: tyrosine-type recombinase/integrase, partial [Gemmatimonadota bacterium]|nr:tyrosine-type recombinase/integrase [Gemmatimonadota bacterium]
KPSSAEVYRRALDHHILPALGKMPVGAVGSEHVTELHYAMRGEPHAANAALKIVAKMISLAVQWGLRDPGPNPCRAVRKYRTQSRERFLTDAEYRRLGRAVAVLEAKGRVSRHAAAAIRLLVLTGCRRNEVLELKWDDIDRTAGELRLREGKTGGRMVPLTPSVADVLADTPRVPDNPWVIVGQRSGARMTNINDPWLIVRDKAGLKNVRIHDLRHSWASRALALGESLSMIGEILGHNSIETTARYAHLARDTVKVSAAKVGGSIGSDILPADVEEKAA